MVAVLEAEGMAVLKNALIVVSWVIFRGNVMRKRGSRRASTVEALIIAEQIVWRPRGRFAIIATRMDILRRTAKTQNALSVAHVAKRDI